MFDTSQANCLGVDPELFFPVGTIKRETEQTLRRICMNCNVFWDCYEYALDVKVDGFWAGTTDKQRKELRQELGIDPVRVDEQYRVDFQVQSQSAKNARAKRAGLQEAG